jgi:hypothetical protein
MYQISLWAHQHKWTARLCFVFIYLLLNLVCLFFNEALLAEGIVVPVYLSYLLCIPFIIALFLYPSRREKSRYVHFYRYQKTMDGILFTFSFLLIICTMNRYANNSLSINLPALSATEIIVKPIKPFHKIKVQTAQAAFVVKHWKQLKHNYRLLRQAYKESSKGEKTALIVLASLVAGLLLMLVLSLSCNLSCSGSEGAALTVLLLGSALVIFLLVVVIRAINRGGKKKEKPAEEKPVDS